MFIETLEQFLQAHPLNSGSLEVKTSLGKD
jgi:hypothetical protein